MSEGEARVPPDCTHPFLKLVHIFFSAWKMRIEEEFISAISEFSNSAQFLFYFLLFFPPIRSTGSFVSFPTLIHAACALAPHMRDGKDKRDEENVK